MNDSENHRTTLLHSQKIGAVSMCESCYEVNVTIKNVSFFMPFFDFKVLSVNILSASKKREDLGKYLVIKIPNQALFFRLTYQEFNEFFELLNIVKLILTAKEIIKNVY